MAKKNAVSAFYLLSEVRYYANDVTVYRSFEQPIDLIKFLFEKRKNSIEFVFINGAERG